MSALGLTAQEAAERLADAPRPPRRRGSRSYADIVWWNTFTVFNLILGTLLVITLVFGDPRDGLFGGVIVANTLIGIIQEVRAKRVLDRLSLLAAPHAHVWRDGELVDLPVDRVVVGDVLHIEPGDQVVADGRLVGARALSLDESILTGEADAVARAVGDEVLSGAYAAVGSGDYLVERIGADSFAERIAAEARGTRAQLSPLQLDINRVLRITVAVMVPLALALIVSLWFRDLSAPHAAATAVAALVPLVPEGLVLLTSITFAVAAIRLGTMGTLAQRLNAVESLASVDTICFDKTGTLTDARIQLTTVVGADGSADVSRARELFGLLAASAAVQNPTMRAIGDGLPAEPVAVIAEVPFSSARKWSGATLAGHGTVVMGAPDVLAGAGVGLDPALSAEIAVHAGAGRRVVLVAQGETPLGEDEQLPADLVAVGAAVLAEGLRDDAVATIAFMVSQGVDLKVISGDGVGTVSAVAAAAGVPNAERALSGADLPTDPDELERVALETTVFARVSPEQKRELLAALARRGRYTAMVGDGVNDVLALKEARLAIVMGNGSQMAKGVGDLVLLSNAFSTVPRAVEEGRRIIRNTHRVAKLFVAKSVYAAALLGTFGLVDTAYPFLPRHTTLASSLTIGIPAFFLALASSDGPVQRERFLRSLAAFVVPAGLIVWLAIAVSYQLARHPLDLPLEQARGVAAITATLVGLAVVIQVERGVERRPVRRWVWGMIAGFLAAIPLGLSVPWLREFFALPWPEPRAWAASLVTAAAAILLLVAVRRIRWLVRIEDPDAVR